MLYTIPHHNHKQFTDKQWVELEENTKAIVVNDNDVVPFYQKEKRFLDECLKYPGWIFSNDEARNFYYSKVIEFIQKRTENFPRGNLTKDLKYIIIGHAPSDFFTIKHETNWLVGYGSQLLQRLMYESNIYPYFTNLWKTPFVNNRETAYPENEAINELCYEIELIYQMRRDFYQIGNKLDCILLGNYFNYYDNTFKNLFNNVIQIYHPAYIMRFGNNHEMYTNWKEQLSRQMK